MSATKYDQVVEKGTTEVLILGAGFIGDLVGADVLTGTPTAPSPTSPDSALVVSSVAKLTTTTTIRGVSHAANQAVTFTVSAGTAGVSYDIQVTCATVNGATLSHLAQVNVVP